MEHCIFGNLLLEQYLTKVCMYHRHPVLRFTYYEKNRWMHDNNRVR